MQSSVGKSLIKIVFDQHRAKCNSRKRAVARTASELGINVEQVYGLFKKEGLSMVEFNSGGQQCNSNWLEKVVEIALCIKAVMRHVDRISSLLGRLNDTSLPVNYRDIESVLYAVSYLSDALNAIRPHKICPHCAALKKEQECCACGGNGWVAASET